MISNDAAARIAKQRGLSLQDAAALQSMAADEAEAERIATEFGGGRVRDSVTAKQREWRASHTVDANGNVRRRDQEENT